MTALTLISEGEIVEAVDAHSLLYAAGLATLRDAPTEELAAVKEKLTLLKSLTGEADCILDDEIIRQQDKDGRWTTHAGPYTIKSSSPSAGTVSYDVEKLRAALADLVVAEVISAAGANGAVETVQPTVVVPYALLRTVLRALGGEEDMASEMDLTDRLQDILADEPEPTYKLKPAGVKALLKIPAARDHIENCEVAVDPGRRKAKVTRS